MITRDIFLYLARQKRARDAIMVVPVARQAAFRFVAGEDLDSALKAVAELNAQGLLSTLDFLGENVETADDALKAVSHYGDLLNRIAGSGAHSTVSLKLTQLGLDGGVPFCQTCVSRILEVAAKHGNFVRIDMEGSDYTSRTIELFRGLRAVHDNVGIVIQACLHRSASDVEDLVAQGANVRLCKGAYREPPDIALPRKIDVDRNYVRLMERMLSTEARSRGVFLAIATHDPAIIAYAKDLVQDNGVRRDEFEFQMLYGVRRDLQRQLAADGYQVRVYVPYGSQWYPYFMRRLAEHPANVAFLIRSVAGEWGA